MDSHEDFARIWAWIKLNHRRIAKTYAIAFTVILVIAIFLVRYMIQLSHASVVEMDPAIRVVNFYIAGIFAIVLGFVVFFPHTIAGAFGLGIPGELPNVSIGKIFREGLGAIPDFDGKKIAESGWNMVVRLVWLIAHIMYFVIIMGVVFGTWGIRNTGLVWPILIALLGVGIGVALFFKGSVWYKRVTMSILAISIGAMLYGTYVHFHPQDQTIAKIETIHERQDDTKKDDIAKVLLKGVKGTGLTNAEKSALKEMEEQRIGIEKLGAEEQKMLKKLQAEQGDRQFGGLVGKWNDLRYEKKFPFVVENFSGGKLEGVRPGNRKFSVTRADIPINGVLHDIRKAVLLNGSSDSFEVGGNGVVNISYAIPTKDKSIVPDRPITIMITIE